MAQVGNHYKIVWIRHSIQLELASSTGMQFNRFTVYLRCHDEEEQKQH